MEFDSDNGNSKSSVGFELPGHPRVEITNRMKELAIEEAFALSRGASCQDQWPRRQPE